ncbi:MAG: amidohydrolase [Chloroflexi bacterium]|nr:amidohydrolase [Chloroflexota bacterium]
MLLFYNGTIHTMDAQHPSPDALVVGDHGRIHFVGSFNQCEAAAGPRARKIDLGGHTLLPGFNDAHVHVWKVGLLLTVQVDVRQGLAPDIPAIQARFRQRARNLPPGTWIIGRGYNEATLPEKRHPTRHDLDAVSTTHPIVLTRTCGHMKVCNSLALQLAGITPDTPAPPGGVIVRENGDLSGLLQETAMGLVDRIIPDLSDDEMALAISAAQEHQLALGITSATDPLLMPNHTRVYRQMEADGALRVRLNGLPIRRPDGGTETLPLPEKFVTPMLRIDCVKFFADGGLSGATAALSVPYKTVGGQGVLRFSDDELFALMYEAHAAGLRIATHAIGDVTIEQVLTTYERLHQRKPVPGLRHRIEHLGLPSAQQLRRCQAIGVIAVPQTVFIAALGTTFRRYLPDAFYARCYPVRAMLDAGLTVALSSDAPVVPDDNPLLGMKAARDRLDANGQALAPEQAVSPYEALYGYTMGGALASGDAENRGSLTPGKWADMIVLSGDPLHTHSENLLELKVQQTYLGGQCVYEA